MSKFQDVRVSLACQGLKSVVGTGRVSQVHLLQYYSSYLSDDALASAFDVLLRDGVLVQLPDGSVYRTRA